MEHCISSMFDSFFQIDLEATPQTLVNLKASMVTIFHQLNLIS